MPHQPRLTFEHFIDKVFMTMLVAAVVYSANQLKSMSESVSDLNVKMAVVLDKISYQERRADDQDKRLDHLENRKH